MGRSRGTMPIQLAGNIRYGGLFECGFGVTLGELVNDIGGGTLTGRPVRAVQVGGPLGAYFPPALFDTPFDYEAFAARDGLIGHGGIVVFDDTVDLAKQARFAMEFCAEESCGKCTPCRIGSVRGMEVIDRIAAGEAVGGESRTAARPLPHDEVRFAVRAGRLHPVSGDERARTFPRRFPPRSPRGRGMSTPIVHLGPRFRGDDGVCENTYALDPRNRLRHAGKLSDRTSHADDRRAGRHSARRHVDHACGDGGRHPHSETLRHRLAGCIRLLPRVPVRDRGPRWHTGVLHHAGRARHEGVHHRRARASRAPRRDGTCI